jgi:hypothetical protein
VRCEAVEQGDAPEERMNEPRDRTQPENVFEPDEPKPDRPMREIAPETAEGDAIEQRRAAGLSDDIDDGPTTMPADASEADVLDQSRAVPFEDDAHDR